MIRIPGNIPIHIYPIFWILAFAIGLLNGGTIWGILMWVAIVFISVLAHEYGHALTAIAFGQRAHIDLLGFGGLTHRHGRKLSLWKEFLISLNGPLASFGLYLLCLFLLRFIRGHTLLYEMMSMMAIANLFWMILNLLPVQPLDGGRLLSIILESIFGIRGVKIALFLSILLAAGVGILAFATHAFLLGALFMMLAFENFRSWQSMMPVVEHDRDDTLQRSLRDAEKEMQSGDPDTAYKKMEEVRAATKKGVLYLTATEHMADILSRQGKYQEAYDLLSPIRAKLEPPSLRLLHNLAFKLRDWETVTKLAGDVYQAFPGYETALTSAMGYALLGEGRPAIGWLQSAIRDGLPNVRAILSKTEFDKIRDLSAFKNLLNNQN